MDQSPLRCRPSSDRTMDQSPLRCRPSLDRTIDQSPLRCCPSLDRTIDQSPLRCPPSLDRTMDQSPLRCRPSLDRTMDQSPLRCRPSSDRTMDQSPLRCRPPEWQSRSRRARASPWQKVLATVVYIAHDILTICVLCLKSLESRLRLRESVKALGASVLKMVVTWLAFASVVGSALLLLPVLLLVYSGMFAWRWCVQCYVCWTVEGVVSVADRSRNCALEGFSEAIRTTILVLEGELDVETVAQKLQKGLVDVRCRRGCRLHPNLRRRLQRLYGILVWTECADFEITDHVVQAPMHFHQTLVSSMNIQEYVSTLCHQSSLRVDIPPWQAIVINGVEKDLERKTWLVVRAHHLLAPLMILPDVSINTHLDPWATVETSTLPLLSAPAATNRLLRTISKEVIPVVRSALKATCDSIKVFSGEIGAFAQKIAPVFHKTLIDEKCYIKSERIFICKLLMVADISIRMPTILKSGVTEVIGYLSIYWNWSFTWRNGLTVISKTFECLLKIPINFLSYLLGRVNSIFVRFIPWLDRIKHSRTPMEQMISDSGLEIYWMIRAAVSLPRLIVEELVETRRAVPLQIWKGYRRPENKRISWGTGVSLKLVKDVQRATGASLPSVLLTATNGAVRNLLKASGLSPPDIIRCTLPVCASRGDVSSSSTFLPLTLPTGSTSVTESLTNVRKCLRNIRGYPEKYLVSTWLLKYVSFLMPESMLAWSTKCLTGHYPVLLSFITGPSKDLDLWGHKLTGLFYLRQPLHEAVISVCVTSYCGMVTAGAVASDWAASNADTLPRGFESSLSELALSCGVTIDPSAPSATPSPNPLGIGGLWRRFSFRDAPPSSPDAQSSPHTPQSRSPIATPSHGQPPNFDYLINREELMTKLSHRHSFSYRRNHDIGRLFNKRLLRSRSSPSGLFADDQADYTTYHDIYNSMPVVQDTKYCAKEDFKQTRTYLERPKIRTLRNNFERQIELRREIVSVREKNPPEVHEDNVQRVDCTVLKVCVTETLRTVEKCGSMTKKFDISVRRNGVDYGIADKKSQVLMLLKLKENIVYQNTTMPTI